MDFVTRTAIAPATGDSIDPAPTSPPRRRVTVLRLLLAISLVAIVAMWVYGLFFAPSVSPEMISDRAWVTRAEATCKTQRALVYGLANARSFKDLTPRSEALRQRADVADRATGYLRDMLQSLRADPPADAASVALLAKWFGEWDIYMSDRDTHVAQFRAGNDPPFAQTANETGAPVPIRMDQFARTNKMSDCQVPLDLG